MTVPVESPDEIINKIANMTRPQLITLLRGLQCDFHLDFSDEYLASLSVERLRHIAVAASLRSRIKAA